MPAQARGNRVAAIGLPAVATAWAQSRIGAAGAGTLAEKPELSAHHIKDGRLLARLPLPAPPAFNGMAAAQARLYLTLTDGSVLCLQAAKGRP